MVWIWPRKAPGIRKHTVISRLTLSSPHAKAFQKLDLPRASQRYQSHQKRFSNSESFHNQHGSKSINAGKRWSNKVTHMEPQCQLVWFCLVQVGNPDTPRASWCAGMNQLAGLTGAEFFSMPKTVSLGQRTALANIMLKRLMAAPLHFALLFGRQRACSQTTMH